MQTTSLIDFGVSEEMKRTTTIFRSPEKAVDIQDSWKSKGRSPELNQSLKLNTHKRLFVPLDVKNGDCGDPKGEGGNAMNVRIERTIKLREED